MEGIMAGVGGLMRELPEGYEQACYDTGAMERGRGIKTPDNLMLLSLYHLLNGCSLKEISQIAELTQLGKVSDVAFMKRFQKCGKWFEWVNENLQWGGRISYRKPSCLERYRVLAADASDVSEKGRSGRIYRLHFALDLFRLKAALYNITTNSVGETLRNFDLREKDLIIADRIYATPTGMAYCFERGADFILRVRRGTFTLLDENGRAMELYSLMSGHEEGELSGFIRKGDALFPVRICYKKKDAESLERTKRRMKQQESKKQITISEETKLFNEYIVLITSLSFGIAYQDILELYRFRWQAEIYFKRLKSILDFGELPKKTPQSALAWLNGKLMVALLMEKFMSGRIFSPSDERQPEFVAGNKDVSPPAQNEYCKPL